MPQNLTIRNVPDSLARKLKTRAERNHRSLQGEVMAILELASVPTIAEPPGERYRASAIGNAAQKKVGSASDQIAEGSTGKSVDRKLTIEELWARGKRLGLSSPNESMRIVRKLRDERHGR
jgi:plasmid stability protein